MAKITIKNYRGISSAEFDLNNITLIGGRNAAGKSSVAQATAALFTGLPLLRGVTKTGAGQLVRSGSANGSARLETETGFVDIAWPKCQVKTEGTTPAATYYATGMSCVLNLDAKQRSAELSEYLKAEPTREDFDAAMKTLNLPAEQQETIWQAIQESGWDGAHARAKEKGAKLKGQWEHITGENYGSKKADNYVPDGWEPDLDGTSEDTLKAELSDAKHVMEGCIAVEAVDDAKRAELEAAVAGIVGIKEQIDVLTNEIGRLTALRNTDMEILKTTRISSQAEPLHCPECKATVELKNGALVAFAGLSEKEIKERTARVDELQSSVDKLSVSISEAQDKLNDARSEMKSAHKADSELQGMSNQGSQNSGGDLEAARSAVAAAEARLRAYQQKTGADAKHRAISINADIMAKLAADGVRQDKLAKALNTLNHGMLYLSGVSGFGTVELDSDLQASLNGTPYHLLSKSERWRVRVTLQLEMSRIDGSAVVIIDGADILVNRDLRNGLFGLLNILGTPALVTMALDEVDAPKYGLPDLSAAGIGASYWIDGGVLKTRADALGGKR